MAGHMTRIMCSVNFGIGKIPTHCSKEALVTLPLSVSGLFLLKSPSPNFCTEIVAVHVHKGKYLYPHVIS